MARRQNLVFADAEMTRTTEPNPDHWADALAQADYIYYQLCAPWRLAEALLQVGKADKGGSELKAMHAEAARIGTQLLGRAEARPGTLVFASTNRSTTPNPLIGTNYGKFDTSSTRVEKR